MSGLEFLKEMCIPGFGTEMNQELTEGLTELGEWDFSMRCEILES